MTLLHPLSTYGTLLFAHTLPTRYFEVYHTYLLYHPPTVCYNLYEAQKPTAGSRAVLQAGLMRRNPTTPLVPPQGFGARGLYPARSCCGRTANPALVQ
jgi:hypothetical protein